MYFDFYRLIQKYSTEFTLVLPSDGGFDDRGKYLSTKTRKSLTGAIMDIDSRKVYQSSGALTTKDKTLFCFTEIPIEGSKVIHKDKVYSVEELTENADFTDVYQYTLKYVSAFNKEASENV
jgi:hypothetical protein